MGRHGLDLVRHGHLLLLDVALLVVALLLESADCGMGLCLCHRLEWPNLAFF